MYILVVYNSIEECLTLKKYLYISINVIHNCDQYNSQSNSLIVYKKMPTYKNKYLHIFINIIHYQKV